MQTRFGQKDCQWFDIDWWFKKFELKESWQNLLNNYRRFIQLYPETIKTLEKLNEKFELIIISNAKREFIEIQLKETNLNQFFKYVFSSISDFNKVKKTSDIYKIVLEKLGIQPNEIIHVGDNKLFDYDSPRKVGIKSFYLNRKKSDKGNNVIFSLSELEKLICNLKNSDQIIQFSEKK